MTEPIYDSEILLAETGKQTKITTRIMLSEDEVMELFNAAFEGWCRVCLNAKTRKNESLCDSCLQDELEARGRQERYGEA